jgi:hypothetical protein
MIARQRTLHRCAGARLRELVTPYEALVTPYEALVTPSVNRLGYVDKRKRMC